MVVNHPVTRDDGALNVFLTEPAFEAWRKRTKVSTEEESASKKLNPAQEMGIPADLDEKLGILRDHLPAVFASYQKLVVLAERSLARLQAASADVSRIALSLHTVAEEMPRCCYRSIPGGQACPLCGGVGRGLGEVGESWTRVAEEGEKRVGGHKLSTLHHADRVDKATAILLGNIEALKTQRDLYLAFRDLFARHDRERIRIMREILNSSLGRSVERQRRCPAKESGNPSKEARDDPLRPKTRLGSGSGKARLCKRCGQLDHRHPFLATGLHPSLYVA